MTGISCRWRSGNRKGMTGFFMGNFLAWLSPASHRKNPFHSLPSSFPGGLRWNFVGEQVHFYSFSFSSFSSWADGKNSSVGFFTFWKRFDSDLLLWGIDGYIFKGWSLCSDIWWVKSWFILINTSNVWSTWAISLQDSIRPAGRVLSFEVLPYVLALIRFLNLCFFFHSLWSLFFRCKDENLPTVFWLQREISVIFLISKWSNPSEKGWRLGILLILTIEFDKKPKLITNWRRKICSKHEVGQWPPRLFRLWL